MIPPYIIDRGDKNERDRQIQLEIPDYTLEYEEWIRRKKEEEPKTEEETVIIIDI